MDQLYELGNQLDILGLYQCHIMFIKCLFIASAPLRSGTSRIVSFRCGEKCIAFSCMNTYTDWNNCNFIRKSILPNFRTNIPAILLKLLKIRSRSGISHKLFFNIHPKYLYSETISIAIPLIVNDRLLTLSRSALNITIFVLEIFNRRSSYNKQVIHQASLVIKVFISFKIRYDNIMMRQFMFKLNQ